MAFADKKGINLASPFKLQAEELLDVRQQVETTAERDQLVTLHAATAGLRVFVKADKCSYVYNGSSWDKITTSVYTHPTGDGNLHVPATGTTHNNQVLTAGSTAGSIAWKTITSSMIADLPKYTLATFGVTATATELNYMKGVTSAVQTQLNNKAAANHTHGEATLTWGGGNITGSCSPVDGGFVDDIGANRFTGLNSGLLLEYSTNGGSTWTSSSSTSSLIGIFGGYYDGSLSISTSANATAQNQLRFTITTDEAYLYAVLSKFAIKICTNGATGSWCTIEAATQASPTAFKTFANKVTINGWPGWNIINISEIYTYGSTASQYQKLRFTFGITGTTANQTNNLEIYKLQAFGRIAYETPTRMGSSGHMYGWDNSLNVGFPKNVNAQSFSINNRPLSNYFASTEHEHPVVTTSANGEVPKLPGDSGKYLNGVGEWTTPPDHTYTLGSFSITASATELNYMKGVTSSVQTQLNGKAASSHTHSVATTGAAGFMPKLAGGTSTFLRADGSWATPPNDNTTYAKFTGASTSAAGAIGLVPAPSAGAANRYLRSDGTWSVPPDNNTTYGTVSTSSAGLVPRLTGSTSAYLRADGSWATPPDTNTTYGTVTTSSAGLVPKLTGSTSTYLRADGTWATPPDTNTTYSLGSFGITASATELNYVKGVTSSIQTQLNGKAASSHTHNYAGSSSAGGKATSAITSDYLSITNTNEVRFNKPSWSAENHLWFGWAWSDGSKTKLISQYNFAGGDGNLTNVAANTFIGALSGNATSATTASSATSATTASKLGTNAGSTTQPVYFSGGVPKACSYTLGKSVPSNAVFTDHTYDLNTMINGLSTGSATPEAADYYIAQYAGGGTTTTSYHRRPVSALAAYVRSTFTIPSVGNGTVSITQGGSSKGSFTMNQSGNTTISLTDNNTTYGTATSSTAGLIKLSGSTSNFLRGDGSWATPSNTDTKVTNTLGTTTVAYVTGTTSSSTNTGTQVFDTGVYLTDTAGELHCNTAVEIGGASLQWDSTNKRISIVFS